MQIDTSVLTAEEKELLLSIGINIDLLAEKANKIDSRSKAPKAVPLVKMSGKIISTCKSCGSITEKFVDHVKRHGEESYMLKAVKEPTHTVTRTYNYKVTDCDCCDSDMKLDKMKKVDLIRIINNLKKEGLCKA